jgi:hypothetical protein
MDLTTSRLWPFDDSTGTMAAAPPELAILALEVPAAQRVVEVDRELAALEGLQHGGISRMSDTGQPTNRSSANQGAA